jgi:hypothetical protein
MFREGQVAAIHAPWCVDFQSRRGEQTPKCRRPLFGIFFPIFSLLAGLLVKLNDSHNA